MACGLFCRPSMTGPIIDQTQQSSFEGKGCGHLLMLCTLCAYMYMCKHMMRQCQCTQMQQCIHVYTLTHTPRRYSTTLDKLSYQLHVFHCMPSTMLITLFDLLLHISIPITIPLSSSSPPLPSPPHHHSIDVPSWLKSLRLHKYALLFAPMSYEDMLVMSEDYLEKNVSIHVHDILCMYIYAGVYVHMQQNL